MNRDQLKRYIVFEGSRGTPCSGLDFPVGFFGYQTSFGKSKNIVGMKLYAPCGPVVIDDDKEITNARLTKNGKFILFLDDRVYNCQASDSLSLFLTSLNKQGLTIFSDLQAQIEEALQEIELKARKN